MLKTLRFLLLCLLITSSSVTAVGYKNGAVGIITPISSYADDVIGHSNFGLINYFRMGDASTSFADRHNANTAVATGGVTFQALALLPGDSMKGALFDGSTGYATLSSNSDWNFEFNTNFTVEALIEPTNAKSLGNEQMIACKKLSSGTFQGWCFGLINVGGSLHLEFYLTNNGSTSQTYIVGSLPVATNSAHHVSVAFIGSNQYLMEVDGIADTAITFTTNNRTGSIKSSASATIGSENGVADFYQGYIQELAVYSVAAQPVAYSAWVYNHAGLFFGHTPIPAMASHPAIILDSDLSTDCDDVGDMAVLAQLAVNGECTIAAVINDSSSNQPAVVEKIITNYKGASCPIYGAYKQTNLKPAGSYASSVISTFKAAYAGGDSTSAAYPDATIAYRSALNSAANKSVNIVMTGQWIPLYNLLQSGPNCSGCPGGVTDAINVSGLQLVVSKVNEIVSESAFFTSSAYYSTHQPAFNLYYASTGSSAPYSSAAIQTLQANNIPLVLVGDEQGDVMTSGPPQGDSDATNPIKDAYDIWGSTVGTLNSLGQRNSWGQLAVLFAVRGFGPFNQVSPGSNFETFFLNGTITVDPSTAANSQITSSPGSMSNVGFTSYSNVYSTLNGLIAP